MQEIQLLDWDTQILGVPTAKINPSRVTVAQLSEIINTLKANKIKLVYWCSDSTDQATQEAAQEFSGFLADRKVTYKLNLNTFTLPNFDAQQLESYTEEYPTPDMQELAVFVGLQSRFRMDPRFSIPQIEKVFHEWLANSTKRKIAKEVLVIRKNNKIAGLVTLGEKDNRGDIGLLAVGSDFRGLHLGTLLVQGSQAWCKQQGYAIAQVVTQQTNVPACRLYESCGYTREKTENFYHFWL